MQRSQEQMSWCRQLTGPGRAAIAVVELVGPRSSECLHRFFQAASSLRWQEGQIRYGQWCDGERKPSCEGQSNTQDQSVAPEILRPSESVGESVVVVCIALDRYEIHCHGGSAAVERIVAEITSVGIECRGGFEVFSGVLDQYGGGRLIREAGEALLSCTTAHTAGFVMAQVRGELERWRTASIQSLQQDRRRPNEIAVQAKEIASRGAFGLRLGRSLDVVLAGPPNVGKSTLINAMVGYDRSITMDMPGTTRDVLDVQTVYGGWPLRLRDTAGLHESDDHIEQQGIQRAMQAIGQADVIVRVSEPGSGDREGIPPHDTSVNDSSNGVYNDQRTICVLNKADKAARSVLQVPQQGPSGVSAGQGTLIHTIATTGHGVSDLLASIVSSIEAASPPTNVAIPLNQSQIDWLIRLCECDFSSGSDKMLSILAEYA